MKHAVIVLPTYNERENIKTLIPSIFKVSSAISSWKISVMVVDDLSPDGTFEEVKKLQLRYGNLYITQGKKEGLGKAYFRGFSYALEALHPDVFFEMDADWSHDPILIPQFLKEIEGGAQFVIGSRYIKGGSIPSDWGLHRKFFSILGNLIIKFGFMIPRIHDWTTGYRAIQASFIKEIIGEMKNYNGYVFQVALLDKAKKKELSIREIPLKFQDRSEGVSKISSIHYIVDTLWYVCCHSSFFKYVVVGAIGFVIDFGFSYLLVEIVGFSILVGTVIAGEMAIVSNFTLNNFWSFAHKRVDHQTSTYVKKFAHFNLISIGAIIIHAVALQITIQVFPRKFWLFYKIPIIILLIIPYSYYMYNKVIWKKKR